MLNSSLVYISSLVFYLSVDIKNKSKSKTQKSHFAELDLVCYVTPACVPLGSEPVMFRSHSVLRDESQSSLSNLSSVGRAAATERYQNHTQIHTLLVA